MGEEDRGRVDKSLDDLVLVSSTPNGKTGCNEFAQRISDHLNKPLANPGRSEFRDGDLKFWMQKGESVRGKNVYLITTIYPDASRRIQELLVWTDALIGASAESLTIVLPYFYGSRQDKKVQRGEPINIRTYINALKGVAAEHASRLAFMTVDLHSPQSLALAMRADNLTALPIFAAHIAQTDYTNSVVVAADAGGVSRAEALKTELGLEKLAFLAKTRDSVDGRSKIYELTGKVGGKTAIVIEDMIDSGGTLVEACKMLRHAGASNILIYATHLLLNGNARRNILTMGRMGATLVGTDTVYHPQETLDSLGIERLPISKLVAEAIRRQYTRTTTVDLYSREAAYGFGIVPRPLQKT